MREKSKIPITVSFDGGIQRYSGLLEIALEGNFVQKPSPGWYAKVDQKTGELGAKMRETDTDSKDFWKDILNDKKFKEFIKQKYSIAFGSIIQEEQDEITA